jgi:carbamoyltransferase
VYILGINAYHGDAAAAIIKHGRLIAAAEEERFNRFKHSAGFPVNAIKYCLEAAGISLEDLDHVGISRDPSAHLHKKILFAATRVVSQARQIKDRLGNAAKVRDLKDDLARAFIWGLKETPARALSQRRASSRASRELLLCFAIRACGTVVDRRFR